MEEIQKKKIDMLRENIQIGSKLCAYELDFSIVEADEEYAAIVGLAKEEKDALVGRTMKECIHPDDVPRIAEEVYGLEKKEGKYECQYRLKTKEGKYRWVKDIGCLEIHEGRRHIRSIVLDIDDTECQMKQPDSTYESVPGGVVFVVIGKDNFYIREANKHYFEMMGVEREEYLGSSGKYTFPEDLPGLREHFLLRAGDRQMVDYEFRTRKERDGEICWYRLLGNYYDSRKDGIEYLCIMLDITSRKTAQFELMREKDKYRMAMKNAADLLYEYDVTSQQLSLFGQNHMTEDTVLCIGEETRIDYRKLLFCNDLIYKGDRKKILSFIRNEEYRYDNIRMLTRNKKNGKEYYDNYEFYCNKIYKGNQISRVVGYVKRISYKTIPVTVQQELHQIFDEHILKEYSFVLKIDVPTESFVPYFIEDCDWEDYRGSRYYDSFLFWWCKNMVASEEQKEISFFLSLEQMLRILHSGEPKGYRFCRVRGKDQKYRYKICYFSFYGSDMNTIIFTVRDVNAPRAEEQYQERESRKILTDALAEAKQAVAERRAFIEYLVKEMSVPIMTMKEVLNMEQGPDVYKEISRCVEYIGEMIGSIEEYIHLQAPGNHSGNSVNLYRICTGVCEEERKISLGLDISINEHISLPHHRLYLMHEFRFKEILINLLGNGIKYAPGGTEINLYIQERELENDRVFIRIIMEDDGPLINKRFYERAVVDGQEENMQDKIVAIGGAGYSISLASKISELLGGTVEFRRGMVRNSVVQIDIPVFFAESAENLVKDLSKTGAGDDCGIDLGGQGILLVENERENTTLTAPLLQVNGAKVYAVSSGEEGIRLLDKFDSGIISVILVDRELPDMNCYEFAKKVKYTKNHRMRKIPIIEMLDGIQSDDTRLGLTSGINSVISKPMNLARLAAMIENLQMNAR